MFCAWPIIAAKWCTSMRVRLPYFPNYRKVFRKERCCMVKYIMYYTQRVCELFDIAYYFPC